MNQPKQEYQLLQILAEQLKQSKTKKKGKDPEWWLNNEESKKILEKIYEIKKNFRYQAPKSNSYNKAGNNNSSQGSAKKKKINFQRR